MEKPIESKQFGDFTVKLYQDTDCKSPLEYCEELCTAYEYGRRQEYRSTTYISGGEEGFEQYLATLVHPDCPNDTSYTMNEHRSAILKKHYARSMVPTQGSSWLEIVVNVKQWANEGSSLSAKEYVDSVAKTYRQWLEGECVGFITTCEGSEVESCWGFYSSEDAYSAAKENFPTRNDQYYFDRYENQ